MLLRAGIILVKYWFSVSDEDRITNPTKRWKPSPPGPTRTARVHRGTPPAWATSSALSIPINFVESRIQSVKTTRLRSCSLVQASSTCASGNTVRSIRRSTDPAICRASLADRTMSGTLTDPMP